MLFWLDNLGVYSYRRGWGDELKNSSMYNMPRFNLTARPNRTLHTCKHTFFGGGGGGEDFNRAKHTTHIMELLTNLLKTK